MAHQIFWNPEYHRTLRKSEADYMEKNEEFFKELN
jgi:hypothetical protein